VIEFKKQTLAALGAAPTAELRTVGIDLRRDWPGALQQSGLIPACRQHGVRRVSTGALINWRAPSADEVAKLVIRWMNQMKGSDLDADRRWCVR
jgi:hypothetical protein